MAIFCTFPQMESAQDLILKYSNPLTIIRKEIVSNLFLIFESCKEILN